MKDDSEEIVVPPSLLLITAITGLPVPLEVLFGGKRETFDVSSFGD